MSSTKRIIAEQVLYRYYGGPVDVNGPVQLPDVYKALEQKINSYFKLRHFDTTLANGETIPDYTMIATYEGIAVNSTNTGQSYATLPTQPISLPKNVGIYLIYPDGKPNNFFIPLQLGQYALLQTDTVLNDLMGQIAYEPKNDKVYFKKDVTTIGINSVTIELCVNDMSQYSETEPLPIPADYEDFLVNELYVQFAGVTPETGDVNQFTNFGQKQNNGK